MNLFETTLLNVVYVFFPLLLYLIYVAYSNNIEKKENNLFLELALFSSFYLGVRYGKSVDSGMWPVLMINVPLMIAYIKKRPVSIISMSGCLILYHQYYFNYPWMILIIEYLSYFGLFLLKKKYGWKDRSFIHGFLIVKAITYIYFLVAGTSQSVFTWNIILSNLATLLLLVVMTYLSFILFEKGEEIVKLHMTIKDLQKEKQIRLSLFQITHEIKNPIAVCKGYLDMFDVNNLEHSQKYVPILKDEINRTLILLQDFLSVQKIKIEKDILDINLLMEEIMVSLDPLFKEKGIQVHSHISEEEVYLMGDYNRLKQVVINLLKNSVEAMTNNRIHKLHVTVKDLKETIKITIEDNGTGISSDHLKRMKDPFFSTKENGTGLGVYLSNEIMKAHNGRIDYESSKKGTVVTLRIPKGECN